MKLLKTYLAVIFLMMIMNISCKKTDLSPVSDSPISKEEKLKDLKSNSESEEPGDGEEHPSIEALKDFAGITNIDVHNLSSSEQGQIGEDIIAKSALILKNEYGLNNADLIQIFGSTTDPNIGIIGMMLEVYKANGGSSSANICQSQVKVIRCLVSSAIPCTILTTFVNTLTGTTTKMDKAWALGVINDMLRMSVNYATPQGLALMAADFTVCMIFSDSAIDNGEGGEYANLIDFEINPGRDASLVFEFNSSGNFYFASTKFVGGAEALQDLTSAAFQSLGNTILYDGIDGKLYIDQSCTTLAPDGYYLDKSLDFLNFPYKEFSYLNGGVIIHSARKSL